MDFMSDLLRDEKSFPTMNILDDFNREGLAIDVNFSRMQAQHLETLWLWTF
jgi:putative transposase